LKKLLQASSEIDGQIKFKEVLRAGLLRELYEESAVLPGDVDFSSFRLTSYFRWISRAAKPEFTALVNLKCNFSDLKTRNTNLKEKAFSKNITSVPLSYLQKSAKQLKIAEGKNDEKLARAMEATVLLASEGLTATHQKWSQSKAGHSELHLSPSCEFAWFAAAMYLSTIDSAEPDKL
jgi:hypothetical protein